jgi:hypothetical protein
LTEREFTKILDWPGLGHNALYIAVGFAWLRFADDGEATIRPDDGASAYQLAAMLSFLIFADNLLGRIKGNRRRLRGWD